MTPPSADVSPGMWGFLAFALLAIVLFLLARNMNARMRRMSYRQKDAGREPWEAQAGDPTDDERRERGEREDGRSSEDD